MRISEHLMETPPRPRIQLVEALDEPAVVVEIKATEFGPTFALSASEPQHLDVIIEALTAASIALVAEKARHAVRTEGATWNRLDVA